MLTYTYYTLHIYTYPHTQITHYISIVVQLSIAHLYMSIYTNYILYYISIHVHNHIFHITYLYTLTFTYHTLHFYTCLHTHIAHYMSSLTYIYYILHIYTCGIHILRSTYLFPHTHIPSSSVLRP